MTDKLIIDLLDENNNQVSYEILDVENYNNKIYAVAFPVDSHDTEVIILREEPLPDNPDQSEYIVETDEQIANAVYEQFKDRQKDNINFVDKEKLINVGEVVEFNNKEYACFKIIERKGTIYAYFVSQEKPVEVKFTKEIIDGDEVKLEIINEPYEKELALALLQDKEMD